MSLPVHSSEQFRSKQQSLTRDLCVFVYAWFSTKYRTLHPLPCPITFVMVHPLALALTGCWTERVNSAFMNILTSCRGLYNKMQSLITAFSGALNCRVWLSKHQTRWHILLNYYELGFLWFTPPPLPKLACENKIRCMTKTLWSMNFFLF